MKNNKGKILFVVITIIAIMCTNIAITFATTKTELQNQNSDLDEQIKKTEGEIEEIEEELSSTMREIRKLNAEISEYEWQVNELDAQIGTLQGEIAKTEIKLGEAEAKFAKQEEMLKNRLVALYEAGETTYLDVLLTSDGLTDFISNYYLVSEIASYDTELLDQMEKNKNEIKVAKEALETSKTQIETVRNNKQATANSLKNSQTTKEGYASQLSEKEKSKQAALDQFEKEKREITNKLAAIAREESNKNTETYIPSNPNASGYIFPVAGLSAANINNKSYPSYPGHTGVDVNINVTGKSVVAVKSGTVVISTASKNSDGSYRSYGEYVVINHHDGTMTLYAHGYPNSRKVSPGQSVSQGQVLMTVGTTGNSTGNHLHFEVRVDGRCVNPMPYLY